MGPDEYTAERSTPVAPLATPPSFDTTYRRADGEVFGADYAWAIDLESFEYDEAPVELVEERWERVAVRTFWYLPHALYGCHWGIHPDAEGPCDEDAEGWWRDPDGSWWQMCKTHRLNATPYGPDGYEVAQRDYAGASGVPTIKAGQE